MFFYQELRKKPSRYLRRVQPSVCNQELTLTLSGMTAIGGALYFRGLN